MLDTKQIDKYSNGELELIKKIFGGDSPNLITLRNILYQYKNTEVLELSEDEVKLLKKILLPENSPETPLNWILNMYQGLKEIRNFSPEGALIHIEANDILVDYIKQQFNEVVHGVQGHILLEELPLENGSLKDNDRFIRMLAYHNICSYIESRIAEIKSKANPPFELTPEEQKKKELQNSVE